MIKTVVIDTNHPGQEDVLTGNGVFVISDQSNATGFDIQIFTSASGQPLEIMDVLGRGIYTHLKVIAEQTEMDFCELYFHIIRSLTEARLEDDEEENEEGTEGNSVPAMPTL